MKKSTIHYIFDKTMYLVLVLMPIFVALLISVNGGATSLGDIFARFSGYFEGVDLYDSIVSVIGPAGTAPLLNSNSIWLADYIVYAIYVTLAHLIIDCLGFIPAAAHAMMVRLGGEYFE